MALYVSKGTISDMSEVQSGRSRSGNYWQRMTLTLDIPGYQGTITKQVFQVFGDVVDNVITFSKGERVEVTWAMYAREWNGRWYNNVDLVGIQYPEEKPADGQQPAAPKQQATPKAKPKPQGYTEGELDPNANVDDLPF